MEAPLEVDTVFNEAVLYCSVAPSETLMSGFATKEQELIW